MTRATYITAIVLSLIFAGLTLWETWVYTLWEHVAEEQKEVQNHLVAAQRLNNFNEQFLRRLAVDSRYDPALAAMLKAHKVNVVISNSSSPALAPLLQDAASNEPPSSPSPASSTNLPPPNHSNP